MADKRTVQKVWFNGREFQRIIWPHAGGAVVIVWGGVQHVRPGVFRAAFMGRRVI